MVDIVNKDDGGSAFPNAPLYALQEEDGVYELLVDEQSSGMTLRDYFAAKAMQGMIVNVEQPRCDYISDTAYAMADAMLRARET